MLGLPDAITACLFDMDGVITQTAKVHDAAWKEMFDEFLRDWSASHNQPFVPFDPAADYDRYVDGKPRLDGTASFLESRGIELPMGEESDPAGKPTIWGLSNKKNDLIQQVIERDGVQAYEGSVRYVNAAREAGLRTAIVSSSANTEAVLKAAGVESLFEVRVDHQVAEAAKLRGKPAPDTFLEAARLLGVEPANATVYEDALAGVAAGRAGKFGFVVGVDRVGQATELHAYGADVVVKDLAELL
ncbi:MAG TPA: beta-phosphoglucomutase family hydrolase [Trebonia sp.]